MPKAHHHEDDEMCSCGPHDCCCDSRPKWSGKSSGACGAIYALGAVGAAVFFLQHSVGFWGGVLAILKGLVWPALLVYKAMGLAGF